MATSLNANVPAAQACLAAGVPARIGFPRLRFAVRRGDAPSRGSARGIGHGSRPGLSARVLLLVACGVLLGLAWASPATAATEPRSDGPVAMPAAGAPGPGVAGLAAPAFGMLAPRPSPPGGSGWTSLKPSRDSRKVFVSSSTGNDQDDGLSSSTPKRTIAAGKALLRHGYPDWLQLKRGDVWHEALGQWTKSGRSAKEPMVVTTYSKATGRALLCTGSGDGVWTNGGGGSPPTIDHVAFVGLHFQADTFSGMGDCVGARMLQPSSDILFEDCMIQGYATNVIFQGFGGHHTNLRLRRSVIVDAHAVAGTAAHSQGLYAFAVDGLLIEENVFDHNGWSETISGAGASIYSHNLYIDNGNTGVSVLGNIIAGAASHGMQLRPGGKAIDNLFVRNSIALSVGGGNYPEPGGVVADVRNNVILDGKDIDANQPRGWGLWLGNIASASVVQNIIANNSLGTQPLGIALDGAQVGEEYPSSGVHNVVFDQNIVFNWGCSLVVVGSSTQLTNLTLLENHLQDLTHPHPLVEHHEPGTLGAFTSAGNRFFAGMLPGTEWTLIGSNPQPIGVWTSLVGDSTSISTKVSYADPNRSLPSYQTSLGKSPSLSAFLAEARKQGKASWRPEYTAAKVNVYFRDGFKSPKP